jgi:hypothetical protein
MNAQERGGVTARPLSCVRGASEAHARREARPIVEPLQVPPRGCSFCWAAALRETEQEDAYAEILSVPPPPAQMIPAALHLLSCGADERRYLYRLFSSPQVERRVGTAPAPNP